MLNKSRFKIRTTYVAGMNNVPSLPRVSANQLGEFAFATDRQKMAIVQNHKFGNPHCAPYYGLALNGLLRGFNAGRFNAEGLRAEAANLQQRPAQSQNQAARFQNNAAMLLQFSTIIPQATPPTGDHQIVRRNAIMPLDGVLISVRPEILTILEGSRDFCYTKLRFSKSKASADSSEIILLLLLEYGRRQSSALANFRPDETVLVDCFARTVHRGHQLPKIRQKQLAIALHEYRHLWTAAGRANPGQGSQSAAR